ncbi:uncharacterized protein SPAPADRAFT_153273 [Spathaspora passalidarum NRRL Y-27907]|uniref:Vacuolar protein sorting-associated protein 41 n=1 Tax=Spathaspora passalidarum (strain NRRL Y-27907 / 11-Y1) TaxID=619300 RepID=G3AMY7_SPAPN|nr:uncharacterized protein SPAPADRAFT_153273 [Spathaspora passalidarum NRRL Y-27907]EGW32401.1 hypothetical protein SPAPADRAFT_153273 [Spathaspora passalidarum NRRL Y-27907]
MPQHNPDSIEETHTVPNEYEKNTAPELIHHDEYNSSEEDSDEEDDSPPKLKYTRLNKLPPNFFNKDPVSTCCIHDSYFIFATHSGVIHISTPDFQPIRTFKAHRASVLSIYTDGTYFATASMDGTVVIGSIVDEKDIVAYNFQRPVHAVVLDKHYSTNRSFISGGMSGKVILSNRSWMGKRTDVVLDEGSGPIVSLERVDDLLFWMNDKGINIYNFSLKQMLLVVDKPEDSPRSDLYWPRVTFPDPNRIIIAWSNYIWSLKISIKQNSDEKVTSSGMSKILPSTASISFRNIQEKEVEIEHIFKVDSLICGITSFTDDLWMILSYDPPTLDDTTGKLQFNNPDLKLINSVTGEVEFEEELGLKNVENLGLNDFTLGSHIETSTKYYIISAKDAVVAQELTLNDRLSWYLETEEFLHAWEISEHLVSPIKRLNYGIQYVDSLIKEDDWVSAGKYLQKFLDIKDIKDNETRSGTITSSSTQDDSYAKEIVNQWEIWSNIYINSGHIIDLTDIIPITSDLPKDIYNQILKYWINTNQEKLHDLITQWDIEVYDVKQIQSQLEDIVRTEDSSQLEKSLVLLYDKSLEPAKAIPHMVHLKDHNIVEYLSKNHILSQFINELPDIISLRFDKDELETLPISKIQSKISDIVSTLVDKRLEVSPKVIVELFSSMPFISFFYLEKLNEIDSYLVAPFGNERVKLYSQFKRESLLPFLHKNTGYDIDEAINICEQNEYIEELVYLLGRIGQNKKALELITTRLNDPIMAIKFAKRQNDKEAWNILLDYSMEKPDFIKALIENSDESSNAYYDPITILKRMPKDIKVPGLNDSVIEFSKNNDLNMILNQIILRIIYQQSKETSQAYKLRRLKGEEIEVDHMTNIIQTFETIVLLRNNENTDLQLEANLTSDPHNMSYETHMKKLLHLKELQRKLT